MNECNLYCEILLSVRGQYDKNGASYYCFTSDVMYKLRWSVSAILSKVKKMHQNKDFCFGSKVFIQPTWISLFGIALFPKVITPDPNFLLRIQSFYSGSKVITPDPKLLLQIQSFTLDPKLLLRKQIRIQSNLIFWYWSMNTWSGHPVHHSTW